MKLLRASPDQFVFLESAFLLAAVVLGFVLIAVAVTGAWLVTRQDALLLGAPAHVGVEAAGRELLAAALLFVAPLSATGAAPAGVPPSQRGAIENERLGTHDAGNIRTMFWNFGMVGDYPPDPGNVDLSVFHSAEVPKGSGMNYSDGITPFVLAKSSITTVPRRSPRG